MPLGRPVVRLMTPPSLKRGHLSWRPRSFHAIRNVTNSDDRVRSAALAFSVRLQPIGEDSLEWRRECGQAWHRLFGRSTPETGLVLSINPFGRDRNRLRHLERPYGVRGLVTKAHPRAGIIRPKICPGGSRYHSAPVQQSPSAMTVQVTSSVDTAYFLAPVGNRGCQFLPSQQRPASIAKQAKLVPAGTNAPPRAGTFAPKTLIFCLCSCAIAHVRLTESRAATVTAFIWFALDFALRLCGPQTPALAQRASTASNGRSNVHLLRKYFRSSLGKSWQQ
jgi:hypothetical protein